MIATIDVGLKNLAICIMNCENKNDFTTYKIPLWEVYNLLDDEKKKCCKLMKNGNVCGKNTIYKFTESENIEYTCKVHCPKDKLKDNNKIHQKKVKDFLLQDIAEIVILKINEILNTHKDLFLGIKKILIELQPKINNKMKFVSHIIYSKFVEFYTLYNANLLKKDKTIVRFVRASNKLKAYKGPVIKCNLKNAYGQRKFLSIEYTKWFLTEKFLNTIAYDNFILHNKKDDLGDVFLMAINALQ